MANNNFNVELQLRAKALGFEDVDKLQKSLRDLAKQGGDAAPEFERLSREIDKLASTGNDVEAFATLSRAVEALAQAETDAATKVAGLKEQLAGLVTATQQASEAERQSLSALRSAQEALNQKKDALKHLRNDTDATGKSTEQYKTSVQALRREIVNSETAIRGLNATYKSAKDAAAEAADAQAKVEKGVRAASRELDNAKDAVLSNAAAMSKYEASLKEAGIATETLGAAETSYIDAVQRVETSVREVVAAREQAIAVAKREAQEEERLAAIVMSTRKQMEQAAKVEADHIIADFNRVKRAEQDMANAAKQAAAELDAAFKSVGTRSVASLEAEIAKVRAAFETLKASGKLSAAELVTASNKAEAEVAKLERQVRELNGTMTLGDRAAKLFGGSVRDIAIGNIAANAVSFLVTKITELGTAFIDSVTRADTMKRALTGIYESSSIAAKQIEFLRKTANENGVAIRDISDAFVQFSASMKLSNVPLQQTNELFKEVTRVAGVFGLSAHKVESILQALSQMANKGVVSMEELRQQLGDALPGALGLAEKGLGLAEGRLAKLVATGKLTTQDFLPAFAEGLKQIKGDTDGLSGSWQRFKNSLDSAFTAIGDAGVANVLIATLKALNAVVRTLATGFQFIIEPIQLGVRALLLFRDALAGRDMDAAMTSFRNEVDKSIGRISSMAQATNDAMGDVLEFGLASKKTGDNLSLTEKAVHALIGTTDKAASSVAILAREQIRQADASGKAEGGTKAVGNAYVQLLDKMEALEKASNANIEAATHHLKAEELRAEAMQKLAKLTGDAATEMKTAIQTTEEVVVASQREVNARKAAVDLTQGQIDAARNEIKTRGDQNGAIQQTIDKLENTLKVQKEAAAQAEGHNAKLREAAIAAKLAAETYGDQSDKLDELSAAYGDARTNLIIYNDEVQRAKDNLLLMGRRLAEGKATQDDVTEAQNRAKVAMEQYDKGVEEAAIAQAKLTDALKDTKEALDRKIQSLASSKTVEDAALKVKLAYSEAMLKGYKAIGDTTNALWAEVEVKRIQQKQMELNIKIMLAEAQAMEESANKIRETIELTRELTAEEALNYEKTVNQVKVKRLEAEATKYQIEQTEREITSLYNGTEARSDSTSTIDQNTAARYRNIEAMQAERMTADGFKANKDGSAAGSFNSMAPMNDLFTLVEKMNAGTLTANDLALAQSAVSQGTIASQWYRSQSIHSTAGMQGASQVEVMLARAREAYSMLNSQSAQKQTSTGGNRTTSGGNSTASGGNRTTSGGNSTASGGGMYSVNITLNGKSTKINAASQSDASALASVFQQLESAAGASA